MKLYTVHDDECTYAVKETIEDARLAARDVWRDVAEPEEWAVSIGEFDTNDRAPMVWTTTEVLKFGWFEETEATR